MKANSTYFGQRDIYQRQDANKNYIFLMPKGPKQKVIKLILAYQCNDMKKLHEIDLPDARHCPVVVAREECNCP